MDTFTVRSIWEGNILSEDDSFTTKGAAIQFAIEAFEGILEFDRGTTVGITVQAIDNRNDGVMWERTVV